MFVSRDATTIASGCDVAIYKGCEKAALSSCAGAAFARHKRAAIVFEAARSCVSSFFIARRAQKSCVSSMRGQNLTKKFKFFQKKLQKFKKK